MIASKTNTMVTKTALVMSRTINGQSSSTEMIPSKLCRATWMITISRQCLKRAIVFLVGRTILNRGDLHHAMAFRLPNLWCFVEGFDGLPSPLVLMLYPTNSSLACGTQPLTVWQCGPWSLFGNWMMPALRGMEIDLQVIQ